MRFTRVFGTCAFLLSRTALALTGPEIAAYFKQHLSAGSSVYLPSDSNYTTQVAQRWDIFAPPTYIVAVKPALPKDVQKIVKYAAAHNVSFLATGGSHGYSTTLSSVTNGIDIDLGNFDTVKVDANSSTVTVGGSVKFGNITGPVYDAGKEIPVGSCSCVGVLGASLGGGIGPFIGLHGMISDSLLSVEMITGTGDLITVSETENSNLFWGLRGAGFNFGIVTSAVYKLYDFTNNGQAMSADLMFAGTSNGSFWQVLKSFEGKVPAEMAIETGIAYNETLGGAYLLVNIIYAGPLEKGKQLIQPFLDLKPVVQNITEIPSKDIETSARFGTDALACRKGILDDVYSLNLYTIDVSTLTNVFNQLATTYVQQPDLQEALLAIVMYSQVGPESIPDDSSAYPYRNVTAYVHFEIGIPSKSDAAKADALGQSVRSKMVATSGAPSLEVYVNYAHGDEGDVAWYAERKLPRLQALKKQYDPQMLFSHYNALTLS